MIIELCDETRVSCRGLRSVSRKTSCDGTVALLICQSASESCSFWILMCYLARQLGHSLCTLSVLFELFLSFSSLFPKCFSRNWSLVSRALYCRFVAFLWSTQSTILDRNGVMERSAGRTCCRCPNFSTAVVGPDVLGWWQQCFATAETAMNDESCWAICREKQNHRGRRKRGGNRQLLHTNNAATFTTRFFCMCICSDTRASSFHPVNKFICYHAYFCCSPLSQHQPWRCNHVSYLSPNFFAAQELILE